jgi:hypothetical protein
MVVDINHGDLKGSGMRLAPPASLSTGHRASRIHLPKRLYGTKHVPRTVGHIS